MDASRRSLARSALGANAVFSLFTGTLLAVAPATVGRWLGVEIDGWLRALGLGLIGHAVALAWAARRPDPLPWARLNVLVIAPYPLLMIGAVATGLIERSLGQGLALADGAIVGFIAVVHGLALRRQAGADVAPQPV